MTRVPRQPPPRRPWRHPQRRPQRRCDLPDPHASGDREDAGTSQPARGDALDDWQAARGWAEAVLREAGLSITRPRLLVLAALRGRQRPVTAQDLHRELGTRLHQRTTHGQRGADGVGLPGLTTIYRVLATLAERGILHCFHPGGGAVTAYRLCAPISHHHLVCRCCGRVEEQPPGPIGEWAAELATANGFAVEDYHAELIGLCAACRPHTTQPQPLDPTTHQPHPTSPPLKRAPRRTHRT